MLTWGRGSASQQERTGGEFPSETVQIIAKPVLRARSVKRKMTECPRWLVTARHRQR